MKNLKDIFTGLALKAVVAGSIVAMGVGIYESQKDLREITLMTEPVEQKAWDDAWSHEKKMHGLAIAGLFSFLAAGAGLIAHGIKKSLKEENNELKGPSI